MMNLILWIFAKLVKWTAPYYEPPEVPQPVSNSDWPENLQDLLSEDMTFDADMSFPFPDHVIRRDTFPLDNLDGYDEGEVFTTEQWGLQVPSGEVHWGSWSGIDFSTPLDRMRMIATLQKTALDMGLNDTDQTANFLSQYKWQIRERNSRIRYRKHGRVIPLTDPAVSAAPEEHHDHDHEHPRNEQQAHVNSHRDLYSGSVGGTS